MEFRQLIRKLFFIAALLSAAAFAQTSPNVDDSLTNWGSCGQSPGFCAGGVISATSFGHTINNASPSLDGEATKLTLTCPSGSGGQTCNYLWYFKPGPNNAANTFQGIWNANLPSLTLVKNLEFDIGHFDAGTRFMMGSQCQIGANWQIWDSCNGVWHDASPTLACSFTANTYHKIQWNTHHDPLTSTACAGGNPCEYYDTLAIDGVAHGPFQSYPACASGDADNVALNTQIDLNATGGTATEYLDETSLSFSTQTYNTQTVIADSTLANATAASPFTRNGFIEMVFPPSTGSADYAPLRAAGSAWDSPLIDGVTIQINMNAVSQINTGSVGAKQPYIPSTSPTGLGNCNGYTADSDQCIKMTGASVGSTFVTFAAPIYFPFSWSTIESTTSPGIQQWFQATPGGVRKTVNLLDFSQSNGSVNGSTPSYMGTATYLALFNPASQDFLNGVVTTIGLTCTGQYTGHTGVAASRSGTTLVTVTQNGHGYTTGQTIWPNATVGSSDYTNTTTGVTITVTDANHYTYNTSGGTATDSATLTLVADSESYIVPYELPFLTARQAFLKAVHLHFNSSYTNAVGGTAAQLGYWRNGQSVGGEVYPFCYTNMAALAAPYTRATDTATAPGVGDDCFGGGCNTWGFVDYYKDDLLFGESLHSYMRLGNSLNNGGTGGSANYGYSRTENNAANVRTNGAGLFDIIGEQGAALGDITAMAANSAQTFSSLNPANMCGNDGCFMAFTSAASGMPLEIQPISISAYDDDNCTTHTKNGGGKCSVPSTGTGGDSGDMRQWLAFYTGLPATDGTNIVTLAGHASIFEIYYRDAAEALDPNFCVISGGSCSTQYTAPGGNYTWWTSSYLNTAFNAIGLGAGCGAQYTTATLQGTSTGDCSYALALKNFHGQH